MPSFMIAEQTIPLKALVNDRGTKYPPRGPRYGSCDKWSRSRLSLKIVKQTIYLEALFIDRGKNYPALGPR